MSSTGVKFPRPTTPPATNPGRTAPGSATVPNPYQNPAPRPATPDFATASIYQLNQPYVDKNNPFKPVSDTTTPPVTPSTSSFSTNQQTTPVQPISANPTGQFSVAAGATPFTIQQNAQTPTTTGTAAKPPAPKPAKKPAAHSSKPSAMDRYLTKDSQYQETVRDLTRALADFKARQLVEKARAGTENSYAQHTMGLQKDQDLSDIANDAASRGIVTSGVYGQRVGDYDTTYNNQLAELGRQYNSQLEDFASALRDFSRQQDLQKEAARTAAIARRSAKLGKVS